MGRTCERCDGSGEYYYSNTATYNHAESMFSGQAFTRDICDKCWGTGDEANPGKDLRMKKLDVRSAMTPQLLRTAQIIHEAKIALCWGKDKVGEREPWPDFSDPATVRAYPHNPIAYVDIALAQAKAVMERG